MIYRISFGNGQVHGSFKTLREAQDALRAERSDQYAPSFHIQRRDADTGEWFASLGAKGRLATGDRDGL